MSARKLHATVRLCALCDAARGSTTLSAVNRGGWRCKWVTESGRTFLAYLCAECAKRR